MIDIHSHTTFGIDDGPDDIDISVDMIRNAKYNGIDEMILTSHFMEDGYRADPSFYLQHIENLKTRLISEKIDVKLYPGNEIMVSPDVLRYIESNQAFTLNGSKYLLMELPLEEEIIYLKDVLFKLTSRGYIPIIAHPERYKYIKEDVQRVNDFIERGALLQVNAGSVYGLYGEKAKNVSKYLLKNKLVHFIGSDAHSPHHVLGRYNDMMKKVESIVGKENLEILTLTNPKAVKENSDDIRSMVDFKSVRWKFW